MLDKAHCLPAYPRYGSVRCLLALPDEGNLFLDDFGQLVFVVVEARPDKTALRYGDGWQQQKQELEVVRVVLVPPSLFGYDAVQVAFL